MECKKIAYMPAKRNGRKIKSSSGMQQDNHGKGGDGEQTKKRRKKEWTDHTVKLEKKLNSDKTATKSYKMKMQILKWIG